MAEPTDKLNINSNELPDAIKPRASQGTANRKRKSDEMLNQHESGNTSIISDLEHPPSLNVECHEVRIKNDVQEELPVSNLTLERTGKMALEQLKQQGNNSLNEIANVNENNDETPSVFSALESINEDCFRQIVRYLNIIDVTNLAATCTRLLDFTEAVVFPKKAKNIYIKMFSEMKVFLNSPFNTTHSFAITLQNLENLISYFGKFVQNFTFLCYKCDSTEQSKIQRSLSNIIEHCKNLRTLHFYCDFQPFTTVQTHVFKGKIGMLQNLKELELCGCPGITNNWPTSLESPSKLEKLTLNGKNEFSDNFFDYFCNLFSLNIIFHNSDWQADDIAKIFDKTGHCLKRLKLRNLDYVRGYETVGVLITEKLSKLEHLDLSFELTDNSEHMLALPYLKSLTITCHEEKSINALLLSLSDNGVIEILSINGGSFDVENENASPLTFNKLISFDWAQNGGMSYFLKSMTRAEMPAIQNICLNRIKTEETNYLLALLESKKTLRNVNLTFDMLLLPPLFWRQLIRILQEPCMPKRPLLQFFTSANLLKQEEVSKVPCNRRLQLHSISFGLFSSRKYPHFLLKLS